MDTNPNANDSQAKLAAILKGDLSDIKLPNPTIVEGYRVRNTIWRGLVAKYKKNGMDDKIIIEKILEYDEFVEKGMITEDLVLKAKKK